MRSRLTCMVWSVACLSLFVLLWITVSVPRFANVRTYSLRHKGVAETKREPTLKEKLRVALRKAATDKKVLLMWYPDDHPFVMLINNGNRNTKTKSCGLCELTTDKSRITDNDTAAVVFYYESVKPSSMPPPHVRRSDQLYVWTNEESPASLMTMARYDAEYADKVQFNATRTYRRDSDIYHPYGGGVRILRKLEKNLTKILKSKRRLAASFVSNCENAHAAKRLKLLKRIVSSGFQLDTRGHCFGKTIQTKTRPKESFVDLLKTYKFYFAFENSYHCRDYITEKVTRNSFQANAVPVVWGATKEDYAAYLPPHSYIHVESFSTIQKLTDYLNYLDKNDSAYLQYFKWRLKLNTQTEQKCGFCQLCRIVHGINVDDTYSPAYNPDAPARPLFSDTMTPRTIPSLSRWIYGTENKECLEIEQ